MSKEAHEIYPGHAQRLSTGGELFNIERFNTKVVLDTYSPLNIYSETKCTIDTMPNKRTTVETDKYVYG